MREELGTPGAVVGAFVLACVFGGLALAIYPGWVSIGEWAHRTDAPAWVQAVGSVTAILVGIGCVLWQIRSQARHSEENRLDRVRLIANALFQCRRSAICYSVMHLGWKDASRHADEAIWWSEELAKIPLLEYPDWRASSAVGLVLADARDFARAVRLGTVESKYLHDRVCGLIDRLTFAEIAIDKHLSKRGSTSPHQGFELEGVTYYPANKVPTAGHFSGTLMKTGIQLKERFEQD